MIPQGDSQTRERLAQKAEKIAALRAKHYREQDGLSVAELREIAALLRAPASAQTTPETDAEPVAWDVERYDLATNQAVVSNRGPFRTREDAELHTRLWPELNGYVVPLYRAPTGARSEESV